MKIEELDIKKLPGSEIEINGELSVEEFNKYRESAVKDISSEIKLDGFRPGNVPEKVLVEKIGEHPILERMAEMAIQNIYPEVAVALHDEQKIHVIGKPEISITKLAKDNPLGYKIKTAVMPEIELPDYKEIAKKVMSGKDDLEVKDEDVQKSLEYLQKARATKNEKGEEVLPELNDDFAKNVGKFETLEALKKTLRENLVEEKKVKAKQKKRAELLEKISEKMKVEIPSIMIESEKTAMLEEMKANIAQMGLPWEEYLKHLKKTEEEVVKSWEKDAEKRVRFGLALEEIGNAEKIEATEEELDKEVEGVLNYYKSAGSENIDKERVRNYARGVLRNEKVFQLLEGENK